MQMIPQRFNHNNFLFLNLKMIKHLDIPVTFLIGHPIRQIYLYRFINPIHFQKLIDIVPVQCPIKILYIAGLVGRDLENLLPAVQVVFVEF